MVFAGTADQHGNARPREMVEPVGPPRSRRFEGRGGNTVKGAYRGQHVGAAQAVVLGGDDTVEM